MAGAVRLASLPVLTALGVLGAVGPLGPATVYAMPSALAQSVSELRIPIKADGATGIMGTLGTAGASGTNGGSRTAQADLFATEYRPAGPGPFPLVLINHGMPRNAAERLEVTGRYREQSLEFVRRGFIVINPVRRGYGKTGGAFAEGNPSCAQPGYLESGLEAARDLLAVIEYARTRTDIDTHRILLVGQSAGGFAALATASLPIDGLRGVISFAGGEGSRGPGDVCAEEQLVDAFGRFAETTRVPTMWLYADNDLYFGPDLVRRLVERYRARGGQVDYRPQAAWGSDGHGFFSSPATIPLWRRDLDTFLATTGLAPLRPLAAGAGGAPTTLR